MSWVAPVHFVVVDDVCRFALHFWAYLAGVPSFGIGDVPRRDDRAEFFWERPLAKVPKDPAHLDRGKPHGLTTPDGRWTVWWVDARGGRIWKHQLSTVLNAIRQPSADFDEDSAPASSGQTIGFIVDVRGPAREIDVQDYRYQAVCKFVRKQGEVGPIVLVSSYRRFTRGWLPMTASEVVHEKTAETFERIKREMVSPSAGSERPAEPGAPRHSHSCPPATDELASPLHILVTGAGFDLGGAMPVVGLGSASTNQLLKEALSGEDLWDPDSSKARCARRKLAFPVPEWLFRDHGTPAPSSVDARAWGLLMDAAKIGDLDTYWENLLKLELEKHGALENELTFDKVAAADREQALREKFQGALALHDWGLTRQVLDAVTETRFEAWLTTNYTRFPNRALDILGDASATSDLRQRPWRILSTSNEATLHLRRILHDDGISGAAQGTRPPQGWATDLGLGSSHRYLFKLHGDIPHVTTMALAASDKEVYSPLSMPIDSLHWLYTTARKHLERLIQTEGRPVVWHVVGHGLKDRLLVDLLVRTFRAGAATPHHFVIVGWNRLRLKDADDPGIALRDALGRSRGWNITCLEAKAHDYMARLKVDRLLDGDFAAHFPVWAEHHGFCVRRSLGPDTDDSTTAPRDPSAV